MGKEKNTEYQERVVEEAKELDVKINALSEFLNSKPNMPASDINVLKNQMRYMTGYMSILEYRIKNF